MKCSCVIHSEETRSSVSVLLMCFLAAFRESLFYLSNFAQNRSAKGSLVVLEEAGCC
jgi:hypothetical protein